MKIELKKKGFKIPISYQSILQGFIYNTFMRDELGSFYHDEGFRLDNKVFKMFVFSNLFGDYAIINKELEFNEHFRFYLSSYDENFIKSFYDFLSNNSNVVLNNQIVEICKVELMDISYFPGVKKVKIKTISPVVVCKTIDKYVNYYKPSDKEFQILITNNLLRKNTAYPCCISQIVFNIEKVHYEKERIMKFKNTFYKAYVTALTISVNFDTMKLIYDSGLSAKGPSGFGMIELVE